jgi:hypothetical protein
MSGKISLVLVAVLFGAAMVAFTALNSSKHSKGMTFEEYKQAYGITYDNKA